MKLIPLTDGSEAIVDDGTPFIACSLFTWYNRNGYAVALMNEHMVSMHRFLMAPAAKDAHLEVDHINRNTLDNRLCNLRLATRSQNAANSPARGGTSQYKGVSWRKDYEKWVATISVEGESIHLGFFATEYAAAVIYDNAARFYFKEFAHTNFPTFPNSPAPLPPKMFVNG